MVISTFGYPRGHLGTPTKFTLVHETEGEYDIAYIHDHAIINYMDGRLVVPDTAKVVLRAFEQKDVFYQPEVYRVIQENRDKRVDLFLTWEPSMLHLPNAVFCPSTDSTQWPNVTPELFQVYEKIKLVSAISSTKDFLPGHLVRLEFINAIKNRVDLYGRGFQGISSKLDGLKDYMFSVTIENCYEENGFTEKIQDCFLTGTIPIYYGTPNIGDFYDINGILTFSNQEELNNILNNLTPELYYSKMTSIMSNYLNAYKYPTTNDAIYDLYFSKLL